MIFINNKMLKSILLLKRLNLRETSSTRKVPKLYKQRQPYVV